jgi:bacterioferritin
VGQDLREQFESDLQIELDVINRLRPGITMCRDKQDHVSANLLEEILGEEEHHVDYLQTQLALMDKIGEELYIAQCLSTPPS